MPQPDTNVTGDEVSSSTTSLRRRLVGWGRWSGPVLWIYLIAQLIGTHLPNPRGVLPIETNDKLLHSGLYFGLVFLAATRHSINKAVTWRIMLSIWGAAALLGALDEVTQMIPGINRKADVADWIADICGAACGLLVWHIVRRAMAHAIRPVD
jgi:VanZ family protein